LGGQRRVLWLLVLVMVIAIVTNVSTPVTVVSYP
jgi:hypothetical protein